MVNEMKIEEPAMRNMTMLTDLYQLTMDAVYLDNSKANEYAAFDMFVRKLPKDWGYMIANGMEDALTYATNIKFFDDDIEYLKDQKIFNDEFLDYLEGFKFNGKIYAMPEGTPVTAGEPLMIVEGNRPESQFVESTFLNLINFQTLIATKANRVVNAAGKAKVADFGLRRAQGMDAAMKGARASYIAGCDSTSNVKAGKDYGIPLSGTHAHSLVMAFDKEEDAFGAYTKTFPNNATLLIDTYDTLEGAKKAVVIGNELEKGGKKLKAVRLDSGDLAELSKGVRKILDGAGLDYVKIIASNDLNEYKIDDLRKAKAPIDGYGVGTEMITAKPIAALPGVYKLADDNHGPRIKLSEGKRTWPGRKQVYRQENDNGNYLYDIMALEDENILGTPLLELRIKDGKRVNPRKILSEIREYCLDCVSHLPYECKTVKAEPYEMEVTPKLAVLADDLEKSYSKKR